MDNQEEVQDEAIGIQIVLDQFGGVQLATQPEAFNPYLLLTMLEMAKQTILAQYMMGVAQERQAAMQGSLIVPQQELLVPRK